jgi:heterodisulfide reductase subunit C
MRDDAHESAIRAAEVQHGGLVYKNGLALCDCGMCYGTTVWVSRATLFRHRRLFKRIRRGQAYADAVDVPVPDVRHVVPSGDDVKSNDTRAIPAR